MEWITAYDVLLATTPIGLQKRARIMLGKGSLPCTSPHEPLRKFTILRFDVRLFTGEQQGVGASLAKSEFQWFISGIVGGVAHAKFTGKRTLIMYKMNDESYALA